MSASTAYEVKRHCDFLLANPGATVPQETRGFNEDTFETFRLRSKEDAPDYRYMPDPNLGELVLSQVGDQRAPLQILDKLSLGANRWNTGKSPTPSLGEARLPPRTVSRIERQGA